MPEGNQGDCIQIVECANSVWDPYSKGDVQTIEAVQRKAARFCMNNYQQKSSDTQMIVELNWDSLEDRRKETRIKLMQRIIGGKVEINAKHI